MRLQNPFAVVSTTGLDAQVLTVLARVEQFLTVQQIYQLLPEEGSLQGVRNAVTRLVAQGTVTVRVTGRSHAYALNRDHLLADALLKIADAKRELLSRMNQAISEWPIQPVTVKIFGSAARNEMRSDSDIDLLIVMPDLAAGDEVADWAMRLTAQITGWTGNDVRPLIYRASEVKPASVLNSVIEDGIDVAGDPSWLRQHLRKGRKTV